MMVKINVGISEYRAGKSPKAISTIGLGSCVGVAIYDKRNGIGGLNHIMLPDSQMFGGSDKVGKFADLALPALMVDLLALGASKYYLQAKIAGGASMFNTPRTNGGISIGERNVCAVEAVLEDLKIPLVARQVGGDKGRTMTLYLKDMSVGIKMISQPEIML